MNESGGVCKQKMINLLASYRRERMKIKKSVGTLTSTKLFIYYFFVINFYIITFIITGKDEIYESKWYAFKVLGFLNDRFTPRKGLVAGDANDQVGRFCYLSFTHTCLAMVKNNEQVLHDLL